MDQPSSLVFLFVFLISRSKGGGGGKGAWKQVDLEEIKVEGVFKVKSYYKNKIPYRYTN